MSKHYNPRYIWSRFMMGRVFLMAKRLEKELNAERGEANPIRVARRVQFYREDPVNVLSFYDGNQAVIVERVLRKAEIPVKLKAYNALVPLENPDEFMKEPLLKAVEYLDGKVNIGISDTLFNLYNQNEVIGFDKVTLDLDISNNCITIEEAKEWGDKVVTALKSLTNAEPIIVWSGCKGIHAVYFLNNIVEIEYLAPLREALIAYSGLEGMGLKLDQQTQEPKHIFRLPLTTNLKSNTKAELIHFTGFSNHVLPADVARTLALLFDPLLGRKVVVTPPQVQVSVPKPFADKVTQWSALIKWLRDNNIKLPDCRKRFAYLLGMYCKQAGIGEGDCEGLLNELVSEVRSEHTRLLHYGYSKPEYLPTVYSFLRGDEWYTCNEVEELRNFRVPRVTTQPKSTVPQPTATAPELKPEAKPEVKPEPKPEAKPVEAKPVEEKRETAPSKPIQTRLARFIEKPREEEKPETKPSEESKQASEPREERLVVINVPTALVEDVARELRAPTTIAETLVNWVVDYLNRPCCWSVGFERLVIDLSRASDEETQFALETLGIEVKERKVTDDGFARLRTVVSTVIKYLEKAGLVEYVRDLGVVNLVRGGQHD